MDDLKFCSISFSIDSTFNQVSKILPQGDAQEKEANVLLTDTTRQTRESIP